MLQDVGIEVVSPVSGDALARVRVLVFLTLLSATRAFLEAMALGKRREILLGHLYIEILKKHSQEIEVFARKMLVAKDPGRVRLTVLKPGALSFE